MKRYISVLLALLLTASLCACGNKAETAPVEEAPVEQAPTWQEQYDLGVRYLSEGNYKEAIIAFEAAIKIDPKRVDAYVGLAEAYIAQDDPEKARKILEQALTVVGERDSVLAALADLESHAVGGRPLDSSEQQNRTLNYSYDKNGAIQWIYEDVYDKQGTLIRSNTYNANWELAAYVIWTKWEENHQGYSCTQYDADGSILYHILETWEGNDCITTHYSPEGNIIEQIICRYDDQFNLLAEESYDADGNLRWSSEGIE